MATCFEHFFSVSCHCNHNNNSTKSFHVESQRCVPGSNQQRFFSFVLSRSLFLQKFSLTKSEILLSCYGINAIRQGIPLGRCIMDCNISNCCPPHVDFILHSNPIFLSSSLLLLFHFRRFLNRGRRRRRRRRRGTPSSEASFENEIPPCHAIPIITSGGDYASLAFLDEDVAWSVFFLSLLGPACKEWVGESVGDGVYDLGSLE